MVNGNYILYGDRPSSESEVVDDHVQTRTAERKTRRKPHRTANELQYSLNMAQQLDNETDSVKFEKKIKEPRLLRYIPTTDVEENFVTEKFETYDLKPASEERPRRYAFTKKPKNPSDGSVNYAHSRSSSTCSSPNNNLPTIAEHIEQFNTYRSRPIPSVPKTEMTSYDSKLDKYFSKPRELKRFSTKGSHPDSLYRVPSGAGGAGAGKMTRLLRMLRWPLALIVVCTALAVFVFFLMPSNLDSDLEVVNGTYWDTNAAAIANAGLRIPGLHAKHGTKRVETTTKEPETQTSSQTKQGSTKTPPEIDFYDPDNDQNYETMPINDKTTETNPIRKLPIPPVFPTRITPEVQYGNEKADANKLRTPKLLDEETNAVPSDSTLKPRITQKPEKPLAIYFTEATTDNVPKTESVDPPITLSEEITTEKYERIYSVLNKKTNPIQEKEFDAISTDETYRFNSHKKPIQVKHTGVQTNFGTEPELSPEVQEFYSRHPANTDIHFTSGHSKFFGIGIEDAEKMTSTTQSSLYNTRVSPTLPTWRDGDDSTTKKYPVINSDVPQCQSPHLALCRGVLPYDLAGPAPLVGKVQITSLLPQIDYLVASNCSDRVKEFMCSLLEPECSPPPYPAKFPCFNLCQSILDTCDGYISRELIPVFNCRQYSHTNCIAARVPCHVRETPCGDGTCVLRDWVCDGTKDCANGKDEEPCSKCPKHEFSCESGGCIPKEWLCDGYKDCPKGEDEVGDKCRDKAPVKAEHREKNQEEDREERREEHREEPGEESAGSAPAPSIRRLNRLGGARHRSDTRRTGENDSSKELLMTSDSSNALKRNFTRRPSPSRLTPYRPKLRQPPPVNPKADEDRSMEKPEDDSVTERQKQVKTQNVETDAPSEENINVDDLAYLSDLMKDKKAKGEEVTKDLLKAETEAMPAQNEQPEILPSPTQSSIVRLQQVDIRPVPGKVLEPTISPMRVFQPEVAPAPAPSDQATRLDKTVSNYEKVIDGAALLRQADEMARAQDSLAAMNSTIYDKYEYDIADKPILSAHASPCPSGELRCVDGRCITLSQLCDGTIDCSDHADEDNCYT